ncbi:hypothetical protein [Azospirillum agricola]|uniref:hypothetical protein n=1 Tax=Azospirillum agricola TaxID=1720247 RepID=UPI000A0F234F|nr:hypothetical protein [Azospirillum agricola]SMH59399.1 hypothetical protein SAMN02982994_5038 [Azospirillum lipoferum]
MSIVTFPQAGHDHASTPSHGPAAGFIAAWYEATPAAILLPPVGRFLKAWFEATPMSIALRMMSR